MHEGRALLGLDIYNQVLLDTLPDDVRSRVMRTFLLLVAIDLLVAACGYIGPGQPGSENQEDTSQCEVVLYFADEWFLPATPGHYTRSDWAVLHNRSKEDTIAGDSVLVWDVAITEADTIATFDAPIAGGAVDIHPGAIVGALDPELRGMGSLFDQSIPLPFLSFDLAYPGVMKWPDRPISIEITLFAGNWLLQPQIRLTPTADESTLKPVDLRLVCGRWQEGIRI